MKNGRLRKNFYYLVLKIFFKMLKYKNEIINIITKLQNKHPNSVVLKRYDKALRKISGIREDIER